MFFENTNIKCMGGLSSTNKDSISVYTKMDVTRVHKGESPTWARGLRFDYIIFHACLYRSNQIPMANIPVLFWINLIIYRMLMVRKEKLH